MKHLKHSLQPWKASIHCHNTWNLNRTSIFNIELSTVYPAAEGASNADNPSSSIGVAQESFGSHESLPKQVLRDPRNSYNVTSEQLFELRLAARLSPYFIE